MAEVTGEVEMWYLVLQGLESGFQFQFEHVPTDVLTQHKAKGRFDNDLFNLIDEDCKTGPFSLQSI